MIVLETVRAECGSGMSQRYAGWRIVFQKAISAAYKELGLREAIRRVPRMSGEPPPQRIFAHTWLSGPVHGSHNTVSRPMPLPHMTESRQWPLPKKRMELHNAWP
jgi:hypothetical protein